MESFILPGSILLYWAYLCVGQQHTTTLPIHFPSGSQCISHEVMQEHHDKLRKTIMDYYNHSSTNSPSTVPVLPAVLHIPVEVMVPPTVLVPLFVPDLPTVPTVFHVSVEVLEAGLE